MTNNFYIHRSDIKDDEWYLLDSLPKHYLYSVTGNFYKYLTITGEGKLLDTYNVSLQSTRIYNLPEFIEKFNEFRLFLLL